jgi:hypothetical protein
MAYESPVVDDRLIWDLHVSMHWLNSVLVADEIKLFEALDTRPDDAAGLAATLGASERGLLALLPMLASLGLLAAHGGRYSLTAPARQFLLPDSPYYWGPVLAVNRIAPFNYQRLRAYVRPDAEKDVLDGPGGDWEAGKIDATTARMITTYMHSHSLAAATGVARLGDFDGVKWILDVGGGSGVFSIALTQRHPDLRCTVLDLPAICELVQEYARVAGATRVDTVAIDMFREPWPQGHDAVFLSNVLHDWSPETCADLLAKAAASLPRGGRIYLHEMLLSESRDGPRTAAALSVHMLIGTRGQQFTFSQLDTLLREAGFRDVQVQSTHSCNSLLHATRQ